MGNVTVIVSFVVCILFNIFLHSLDVYSDIDLSKKALTFNLGDSLVLAGCRVCYGKEEKDVFSYKNNSCKQCLVKNELFFCGQSFYILDELHQLENSDTCANKVIHDGYDGKMVSSTLTGKSQSCERDDYCCIEINKKSIVSSSLDQLDRRILAYHTDFVYDENLIHKNHDSYILSGVSSNYHCQKVFIDYFSWTHTVFYDFLNTTIPQLKNQNQHRKYFKFTKSGNGQVLLEKGFGFKDDCGVLVQNKRGNSVKHNGENTCGSDPCLVHLQNLKYFANISTLDTWQQDIYNYGIKYGGKTCQHLWWYGLATLVPILFNLTFNMLVFLEDIKLGNASKKDIVFVLAMSYPQWKTVKFLFEYIHHKNEARQDKAKKDFDDRVGLLEPFLEAAFQVHISLAITITVEGFYPKDSAGYTISTFNDYNQALPLITHLTSLISSSFGMSKFFLTGPIPILPTDSPINGLISLPFVSMILLNTMFSARVMCIENAFFSSYRYQHYLKDRNVIQTAIDPIIPTEYRLLAYFTPSLISFVINAIRLASTGAKLKCYVRKYPQILVASCFTPFMFEGCEGNSIRIWKLGSVLNAFSSTGKRNMMLFECQKGTRRLINKKYCHTRNIVDLGRIELVSNQILLSEQTKITLSYDENSLLSIDEVRINGNVEDIPIPTIARESRKNYKDTKLAIINILAAVSGIDVEELSAKVTFDINGQNDADHTDSKLSLEIPLHNIDDKINDSNDYNEIFDQFDMVIDVRSPNEFADDHLPNAINLPVLNDEQRSDVGTIYFNDPSSARGIGAAIITRNISRIIHSHFLSLPRDTKILVYCWRGGLRSKSLSVILRQIGFNAVKLLNGGYKSFRKHIRESLPTLINKHEYIVLAGRTGTGKSLILDCLNENGENVLDLEELAKHKGSVLGAFMESEQPSQKRFDNSLWNVLRKIKQGKPIWIEKEGQKIGNLRVPKELCYIISNSRRICLDVDIEKRVEYLLKDYKYFLDKPELLLAALEQLTKHSGKRKVSTWKRMVEEGKFRELVVSLLTDYYDPLYNSNDIKNSTIKTEYISTYTVPSSLTLSKITILDSPVIDEILKLKCK